MYQCLQFILTQACVYYHKSVLFLFTIKLKYTLFHLNHPYLPKYLFLLFKVGIFYWTLILRKRDFKFSPTKHLFYLLKAIERDYLINLIKNVFFYNSGNVFALQFLKEGNKLYYKLSLWQPHCRYYRRCTKEKKFYHKLNK